MSLAASSDFSYDISGHLMFLITSPATISRARSSARLLNSPWFPMWRVVKTAPARCSLRATPRAQVLTATSVLLRRFSSNSMLLASLTPTLSAIFKRKRTASPSLTPIPSKNRIARSYTSSGDTMMPPKAPPASATMPAISLDSSTQAISTSYSFAACLLNSLVCRTISWLSSPIQASLRTTP